MRHRKTGRILATVTGSVPHRAGPSRRYPPPTPLWDAAIAGWLRSAAGPGWTDSTAEWRRRQVAQLARDYPAGPWTVTADDLTDWLTRHSPGWTPRTVRAHRSAVRSFYSWARLTGQTSTDPSRSLASATRRPSGPPSRRPPLPAGWAEPVTAWLRWLAAGRMPVSSLELRDYQINRLAQQHPAGPWTVTADDLTGWLTDGGWAPETIRSHRSAVRSFYGWAHAAGRTDVDPSRLLRPIQRTPHAPRPAAEDTITAALAGAEPRVYLMIMLGARHGLRRGEIAQLHSRDLLRTDAATWSLLVHGKGGRERYVPLLADTARALRELPPGWAFPNGRGRGSHLTAPYVGKLISQTLPTGVTPHQLRHRFASRAYQLTGDIRTVQELLGHASVATTQVYTATSPAAHRAAVQAAGRIG